MARFNEDAIKKPQLEELPPLPDEETEAAAADEPVEEEEEEEEANETQSVTDSAPASDSDSSSASSLQQAGEPATTETTNTNSKESGPKPEPKKHSPEYEKILAQRKRIELENKRKLDEYNALVEKGRQQVKDLNLRFGDWYFVVSNDTFQKVRLGKSDVVKEKAINGEPASAGGKSSAAGTPGSAVPGLPSFPGAGN
jgi:hypothetical protein